MSASALRSQLRIVSSIARRRLQRACHNIATRLTSQNDGHSAGRPLGRHKYLWDRHASGAAREPRRGLPRAEARSSSSEPQREPGHGEEGRTAGRPGELRADADVPYDRRGQLVAQADLEPDDRRFATRHGLVREHVGDEGRPSECRRPDRIARGRTVRQTWLDAREGRGLDQKYGVKQEERWRRVGSRERPGDRGQNRRERHDLEPGRRQCGEGDGRSRAQHLTRSTVGGLVAATIVMIVGVRGDRAGVSVKGSGADMAHHHQDSVVTR